MDNLKILDCTLRDGGRVIDCNFGKDTIQSIFVDLQDAGIDIIEMGFIRNNIKYSTGSSFFTHLEQIKEYVIRKQESDE